MHGGEIMSTCDPKGHLCNEIPFVTLNYSLNL
jgi:hypothetical protein